MKRVPILAVGCLLLLPVAVRSQTAESLKGDFARESRLLDEAIDDFGRSRANEKAAIDALRELSTRLDEALADSNVSVDFLNGLEAQLATARDRACACAEHVQSRADLRGAGAGAGQ